MAKVLVYGEEWQIATVNHSGVAAVRFDWGFIWSVRVCNRWDGVRSMVVNDNGGMRWRCCGGGVFST
ncbi:hypothetical protein Tco_1122945, partial [Tanacetum coccineum]